MAANFRVFLHRNSDNLHVKLSGDFDGSSAHQLLEILKRNYRRTSKIFIHTSSLNRIHPFGRDVFQSNMDFIEGAATFLVFTGENSSQLAPKREKKNMILQA